jgi:hypothetical protein
MGQNSKKLTGGPPDSMGGMPWWGRGKGRLCGPEAVVEGASDMEAGDEFKEGFG